MAISTIHQPFVLTHIQCDKVSIMEIITGIISHTAAQDQQSRPLLTNQGHSTTQNHTHTILTSQRGCNQSTNRHLTIQLFFSLSNCLKKKKIFSNFSLVLQFQSPNHCNIFWMEKPWRRDDAVSGWHTALHVGKGHACFACKPQSQSHVCMCSHDRERGQKVMLSISLCVASGSPTCLHTDKSILTGFTWTVI